ncbi:MAG: DUF5663 domain-containing protein [Solirubrobacteraceae bacterium MAG38_C4-C5]|nr:DUF5663 domain-containing protein [Candidatus Siliceabacter maunaloa]
MQLNDDFLKRVGLGDLPEAVKPAYLRRVREELQFNVGTRIAGDMTEEQLEEFEALRDGPRRIAYAWLHINFPAYHRIVSEELAAACRRLADQAPTILALELAVHSTAGPDGAPKPANADPKEA